MCFFFQYVSLRKYARICKFPVCSRPWQFIQTTFHHLLPSQSLLTNKSIWSPKLTNDGATVSKFILFSMTHELWRVGFQYTAWSLKTLGMASSLHYRVLEMPNYMTRAITGGWCLAVSHFFVLVSSLPLTSHVTSLTISFLIYKMGVKLATLQDYGGD